jgi:diguanylate cyclase (GGDEF)-like protein
MQRRPTFEEEHDVTERLRVYREEYSARLPERIYEIRTVWEKLNTYWQREAAEIFHRQLHTIAGSSAIFGFEALSEAARAAERLARPLIEQDHAPTQPQIEAIDLHLATLDQIIDALQQIDQQSANGTKLDVALFDIPDQDRLSGYIELSGFQVRSFTTVEQALLARPTLMISPFERVDFLRNLRMAQRLPPIIFIADHDDLEMRLAAVSAGGQAFLVSPVHQQNLSAILEQFLVQAPSAQVLVIDDREQSASRILNELMAAKMSALVATSPTDIQAGIASLRPDAVILSYELQTLQSLHLLEALRQIETFYHIPIFLVADEMGTEARQTALRIGCDQIVLRTAQAGWLAATIKQQIERLRFGQVGNGRDRLTGLMSANAFRDYLAHELADSLRHQRPLALALLSIDIVETVELSVGHQPNNQVLKQLAALLERELRQSDIVGRLTNDTFALLLPNTTGKDAVGVVRRLQARFATTKMTVGGQHMRATFSSGISSCPPIGSVEQLLQTADVALFVARQQTNERVVLASLNQQDQEPENQNIPTVAQLSSSETDQLAGIFEVLIVDDDPDMRRVIELWLYQRPFRITAVTDGEMALRKIQEKVPDLIFLDVLMTGMSGLEVLERIRALRVDVVVILITAFGSEGMAIGALRGGADDYLRKPFNQQEFQAVVERNIARLELRRQNIALQLQLEEKHRQLENELARAAQVQADLLPDEAPILQDYELAARCVPARDVGGDFYDWFFPQMGTLSVTLGDVMGKGMPAALLMTTVRATMRAVARHTNPQINMLHVVDALAPDLERAQSFVTMFHSNLHLASGKLQFVDAGHGCAVVLRYNGSVQTNLEPRGYPLGLYDLTTYKAGDILLEPGDTLILFSDGILDVFPQSFYQGPAAVVSELRPDQSATEMLDHIFSNIETATSPPDDLTVLILQRKLRS